MLPKLISNIILAVIAIFVIYTIFPSLRELLLSFLGKEKKRNVTKSDFDKMVQTRVDQLSKGSSIGTKATGTSSNKGKKIRTGWDYLIENNYFIDTENFERLERLRKSTEWGDGEELMDFIKTYQKHSGIELNETVLTREVKLSLTKNEIIKNFPKKNISFETFKDMVILKIFCENVNNSKASSLSLLAKKLGLKIEEVQYLLNISILKRLNLDWKNEVEAYINKITTTTNQQNLVKSYESVQQLTQDLTKNLDIIIPLKPIKQAFRDIIDPVLIKKKYKKLVSIYHPDKWIFLEKSPIIDQRLRENFDFIKKAYEDTLS